MKRQLAQLERVVEREADLLVGLHAPAPRPEVVARVKDSVRAEAARLGRPTSAWRILPRWAGVAAAVLLAVGLQGIFVSSHTPDAADLLDVWVDAIDDSSDEFTLLVSDDWLLEESDGEYGGPIDGLFESLDSSLEQMGALRQLGAS